MEANESITDFLKGIEQELNMLPQSSQRRAVYNRFGDCIEFLLDDVATVAERVDEVLTIYKSVETGRSIGFQIKDVAALAKEAGSPAFGVHASIRDGQLERISITVGELLMFAYERGHSVIKRRKGYVDAISLSGNQEVCLEPEVVSI
jgi:hypothetical protein